jgi:transposase
MIDVDLFQKALCLCPSWYVKGSVFSLDKKLLTIQIDFTKGAHFSCPDCGQADCPVHDTQDHKWRHLNFFQYECYLEARVPRVRCKRCGVKLVKVPWARPHCGFTYLFEGLVMSLVQQMPVSAAGRIVREHDTRLWRVLVHYVTSARSKLEFGSVTAVGMDETACRRGHNYVTVFVDLTTSRVIFVTEGKDAQTLIEFKIDLWRHGSDGDQIRDFSCDMSPAFIKGIETDFVKAEITFDRFHVMKLINEAVDKVRREEQREKPLLLKKTRYVWLTSPENRTAKQTEKLQGLLLDKFNLKTARAYRIGLNFREFWHQAPTEAEAFLRQWHWRASHSALAPIRDVAGTIKRHWRGVLNWFRTGYNNGVLEGLNSVIQAVKSRARGFRTTENFKAMIYLIGSKLDFSLPT